MAEELTLESLHAQLSALAKSHEASVASLDELRQGQAAVLAEVRSAAAVVGELREEQRLLAEKLEANNVAGVLQTVRELRDDIQRRPDSSAIDALLQLKLDKKSGEARLRDLAAAREEVEDRLRSAEAAIDALRQQTNTRRRAVEVEMLDMNEKLARMHNAAPMHRAFGVSVGNASHGRGVTQVAKLTDYAVASGNSRCGNAGVGRCRPSSASVAPPRSAVAAAEAAEGGAAVSVKDSVGAIRLQERARSPPRGPSSPGAVASDRALVAAAEVAETATTVEHGGGGGGGGGTPRAAAAEQTAPPAPPSTYAAGRTGVRGSRPLTAGGRGSRPPPPQPPQPQRPQSARGRAKPTAADVPVATKTAEPPVAPAAPAAPAAAPSAAAAPPAAAPSPAAAAVEAAVALARSNPPTVNVSDLVVNSEGISGWGESSGLSMVGRPAGGFRPTVPLRGAASDMDRPVAPSGLARPGVALPSKVAPGRTGFDVRPMTSPRVERGGRCRKRWHADVATGGGRRVWDNGVGASTASADALCLRVSPLRMRRFVRRARLSAHRERHRGRQPGGAGPGRGRAEPARGRGVDDGRAHAAPRAADALGQQGGLVARPRRCRVGGRAHAQPAARQHARPRGVCREQAEGELLRRGGSESGV